MTVYETVAGAIRIAREEQDPHTPWSDAARQQWIGYVAALRQVGVLSAEESLRLLRDELDASDADAEYAAYVQETNLHSADDLVDLLRRDVEAA